MVSNDLAQRMANRYLLAQERIKKILRDFTDEDVRRIGKAKQPANFWRLVDALAEGADRETNAHLRGWDTYQEQAADLQAVKEYDEMARMKYEMKAGA